MPIHFNRSTNPAQARIAGWPKANHKIYQKLGASREELEELQYFFQGTIVLPTDPEYDQDRQGNPLYNEYPKIIAYCTVVNDVRLALKWARQKKDWVVTCRSGGHSTAGFSVNNGMVLDVSQMNLVTIDKTTMTARVSAGANWGGVIDELDANQVHTITGDCGSVGVAGYTMGGGYGFTSREFGMCLDNVLQMTVMLYDGTIVYATQTNHPDLFWAMRGGTGNNFGVLLEIVYRIYNKNLFWGFGIRWPLANPTDVSNAAAALTLLQAKYTKTGAPKELGHQTVLATMVDGTKALAMFGMFDGTQQQGMNALAQLLAVPGANLFINKVDTYKNLNNSLLDDNLHPPPNPSVVELIEFKRSGYIGKPLGPADWTKIINYFLTSPNIYDIVAIEAYGGAINAVPKYDTAFIHRDVYMDMFFDSFFDEKGTVTSRAKAKQWLDGYMEIMQAYFNGHIYQNYPVRDLPDFGTTYWDKKAFDQLSRIKTIYDPQNFFHFEQSIPPNVQPGGVKPASSGKKRPTKKVLRSKTKKKDTRKKKPVVKRKRVR